MNRPLLEGNGVLRLLDFGDGKALEQIEVARMPSLLALSSNRLARRPGRIQCGDGRADLRCDRHPADRGWQGRGLADLLLGDLRPARIFLEDTAFS